MTDYEAESKLRLIMPQNNDDLLIHRALIREVLLRATPLPVTFADRDDFSTCGVYPVHYVEPTDDVMSILDQPLHKGEARLSVDDCGGLYITVDCGLCHIHERLLVI